MFSLFLKHERVIIKLDFRAGKEREKGALWKKSYKNQKQIFLNESLWLKPVVLHLEKSRKLILLRQPELWTIQHLEMLIHQNNF